MGFALVSCTVLQFPKTATGAACVALARHQPALARSPFAELYDELQGLPEALRSEFPDLAVDFLATVFRAPRSEGGGGSKPARWVAAHSGPALQASPGSQEVCDGLLLPLA